MNLNLVVRHLLNFFIQVQVWCIIHTVLSIRNILLFSRDTYLHYETFAEFYVRTDVVPIVQHFNRCMHVICTFRQMIGGCVTAVH